MYALGGKRCRPSSFVIHFLKTGQRIRPSAQDVEDLETELEALVLALQKDRELVRKTALTVVTVIGGLADEFSLYCQPLVPNLNMAWSLIKLFGFNLTSQN